MSSGTVRKSLLYFRPRKIINVPKFPLIITGRHLHSAEQQQLSPPTETTKSFKSISTSKTINALNLAGPHSSNSSTQPSIPLVVSESVKELLPLLSTQPSHYVTIHIYGWPYLVTVGDTVRLPFRIPGVIPGDILRLNRAASIGSRDYTLKGMPYIDENLFECRATVMGTESEPMRIKEKKKRRNRRVKTVKSKHRFTILRIAELKIKSLQDIEPKSEV